MLYFRGSGNSLVSPAPGCQAIESLYLPKVRERNNSKKVSRKAIAKSSIINKTDKQTSQGLGENPH